MATKTDKVHTFTVMHDKGERVNGKKVRPYEQFKSVMTPEFEKKVKMGFLVLETPKASKTRSKSARHK